MDKLFNSFCVRILFLLVVSLIGILVVQHLLSLRTERQNTEKAKALIAGVALGVNSISSNDYLYKLRNNTKEPMLDRVANVLVVDEQLRVRDSLNKQYIPVENPNYDPSKVTSLENERLKYFPLNDVSDLPSEKILALNTKEENLLPPTISTTNFALDSQDPRAFFIPIKGETNDNREVTWHVVVVLSPEDSSEIVNLKAARPLLYTSATFFVVSLLMMILIWQITRSKKTRPQTLRLTLR